METKKAHNKKFDYTTIADQLKTVSWSNDSHYSVVVKPVDRIPTFTLTTKSIIPNSQSRMASRFSVMSQNYVDHMTIKCFLFSMPFLLPESSILL